MIAFSKIINKFKFISLNICNRMENKLKCKNLKFWGKFSPYSWIRNFWKKNSRKLIFLKKLENLRKSTQKLVFFTILGIQQFSDYNMILRILKYPNLVWKIIFLKRLLTSRTPPTSNQNLFIRSNIEVYPSKYFKFI